MAIKIALEFGHTSMLRARTTPEGYTHDWDLYVRGADNADISQYVKKVVFVLHDTFSNPKRTVKNPPYSLKESGYAGFILPIVIHLKNNDEPKKIEFQYDLTLQDCGPPLNSVLTHTELFLSPSDEFRRKLLKGGGILVPATEEGHDKSESKVSVPMVGKPKLSGSDTKKHRVSEPKTVFADLFGVPIKTSKVSPENKSKTGEKTSYQKLPPDKSEKNESKAAKTKHSPHKDGKRDKNNSEEKEKKDKKGKDVTRDKERSKEKSKRPPSPVSSKNSHASPSSKRPPSPAAPAVKKQQLSPPDSGSAQKSSSSPKIREKDHKKLATEKESSKDKDKVKEAPKSSSSSGGTNAGSLEELKNDKKKKKYKDEKDPERKDKTRDKDRDKVKEPKSSDSKKSLDKVDKHDKTEKDKPQESKQLKDGKKSPKPVKEDRSNSKSRSDKPPEVVEKVKDPRSDKDRQKHKHRKKEKKERTDDSRERERRDKRDKKNYEKESASVTSNPPQTNSAIPETHDRDRDNSSDSANSGDEEDSKTMVSGKIEPETVKNNTESQQRLARPLSPGSDHVKRERSDKVKKEKLKPVRGSNATGSTAVGGGGTGGNNGNEERDNRKRKRRSDSKGEEEVPAKREKDTGFSPPLEPVSSSQSPVTIEMTAGYTAAKELPEEMETVKQEFEHESEQIAPDSTNSVLIESETDEPLVFSEDYVSQLKDLQQKIMTLQDNQELQRVVQVIAATGQYEITRKTFDFDLCALDRRTVQRLQQFFSAS